MRLRIESVRCEPLSVPLLDPFVIATGRVDATLSALVTVRLSSGSATFEGLGEAACLPPVTREDQPDALRELSRAAPLVEGRTVDTDNLPGLHALLDPVLLHWPVARAGLEMALLDAMARARGVPLFTLLAGIRAADVKPVVTDITLPILAPERVAELAKEWWAKGFRSFKVKVGRALNEDLANLAAIATATPAARLRIDANCGYSAEEALLFLEALARHRFHVECFEQPCGTDALADMAKVAAATDIPVVADESVKRVEDLAKVLSAQAADGVNLKIAKSGGLLRAFEIGFLAKHKGMSLMVGGMVETRLGMTAATHLAAALGGVEFPDLDTAWLLREDPFDGGYVASGPNYTLPDVPGLGLTLRAPLTKTTELK